MDWEPPGDAWNEFAPPHDDPEALCRLGHASVEDAVKTLATVQSEPRDLIRAGAHLGSFRELDVCACLRRVIDGRQPHGDSRDLGTFWAKHVCRMSDGVVVRPRCLMLKRGRPRPPMDRSRYYQHGLAWPLFGHPAGRSSNRHGLDGLTWRKLVD